MEEDVSAVFVTRGDAAPVVQVGKGVFDAVSLAVEALIVENRILRFLRGKMPRCLRAIAQQVGIAGPVSEEMSGGRQVAQKRESATTVSHPAWRDIEVQQSDFFGA